MLFFQDLWTLFGQEYDFGGVHSVDYTIVSIIGVPKQIRTGGASQFTSEIAADMASLRRFENLCSGVPYLSQRNR